eukprot:TRINITY_DN72_c0_g1_i1.p2 TRINITY_DN72_c0_g1~~TRINITY_DN72_c0_g1_i1.p2  ORF type:complete len:169 (-),score=66.60 TRINITY_DN72_c0_g1_i1:386-892(-)
MKPDWDKLMDEFKGSKTAIVADVDCTTGGKDLCSEHGIRGYPSIKYGDPNDLQDYKGGRTFKDLQKFAQENLGPQCSPDNLDLCDSAKKTQIEEFMKMSKEDLAAKIKEQNAAMEKLESDFKAFVDGLQKSYTEANEKKEQDLKDLKDSGLGLMKSVAAHKAKSKSEL